MIINYYQLDDGRIWSTAANTWVTETNPDYQAWLGAGNLACPAQDEQQQSTFQGLLTILEFYDLPCPLPQLESDLQPDPQTCLEKARVTRLQEIIVKSNAVNLAMRSKYSLGEVDTFQQQREEAQKVLAGESLPENALLPVLVAGENTVTTQPTTLEDFARRVMFNVQQAEILRDAVLYQQRAFETSIKEIMASDLSPLAKIQSLGQLTINYTLPGGSYGGM